MPSKYDREYARDIPLPDWLKEFADGNLNKSGTTIEDIRNLFNTKSELDSVEARVEELREMVGLDAIEKIASPEKIPGGLAEGQTDEKYDEEQLGKGIGVEMEHTHDWEVAKEITKDHLEESKDFKDGEGGKYYDKLEEGEKKIENEIEKAHKASQIQKLVSLANHLEDMGCVECALYIDSMIRKLSGTQQLSIMTEQITEATQEFYLSKRAKEKNIFEKFPKLETFIRNVCRSRGGYVELPAIQTMIRNERSENVDVHNEELVEFIKKCLKENEQELQDDSTHDGEFVSEVRMYDDDGNRTVFYEPPSGTI